MPRTPIAALAGGTLWTLTTAPQVVGAIVAPQSEVQVTVTQHGNLTPLTVYAAESGTDVLTQPVLTSVGGELPGFLDVATLSASGADLQVALSGGTETVALVAPGVVGGGGSAAGVSSFNTRSGAVALTKADVTATGLAAADIGAEPAGTAATVAAADIAALNLGTASTHAATDFVPAAAPVALLPKSITEGAGISNVTATPLAASTKTTAALTIPTGFAGGDIVEPSVLWDPTAPFLGYEYVLCAAPFFQSNAALENPCLWVSQDGNTWVPVVNGVPTPAGTPTAIFPQGVQGDGNNSDPYLYRGPDGTYYLYWNQFLNASPAGTGTGGNTWAIKMSKASSLAGPWSTPINVIATVLTTSRPTCPSVFWDQATNLWHMYALEFANTSATFITHYTATNPAGPWTQLANPSIPLPSGFTSQEWWHLNAYKWGSLHVLIVDDSPKAAESNPGNLWLLTSADRGVTWTVPSAPLLTTAQANAYRSALVPTRLGYGDGFDLFYGSGESPWALHRTTITFADPAVAAAQAAAQAASIPLAQKGAASGVATLDVSGQVPASQLANAGSGGTGGPPTGTAGGALGGTYPNPTLNPSLVQSFRANAGALTASANNQVAVVFPTAFPDANYTIQVVFEDTLNRTTDTTVVRHIYGRAATGCTVIVNPSNAYTTGQGLLHVFAIHDTAV